MSRKDQNNLLRVTQMNAVYLDKEILKCLQEGLRDATKYLPVRSVFKVMFVFQFCLFFKKSIASRLPWIVNYN